MPTPRRTGPVWSLYFSRSSFQPMASAPFRMHSRRPVEWQVMPLKGSTYPRGIMFFSRSSMGSKPNWRAMSSIMHSAAKLHWGIP